MSWEVFRGPKWAEAELSRHLSPDPTPTTDLYTQPAPASIPPPAPASPQGKERTCPFEASDGVGQRQALEPRLLTAGKFLPEVVA